jgi:hypothetical protein
LFLKIKDDASEIMILLKEISSKNEDLKGVLKKVIIIKALFLLKTRYFQAS